jgi:hypothetical protein
MKKTRTMLTLGAAVASLALLIAASPATNPNENLTQGAWAKMLLDRLGFSASLPPTAGATEAADVLGGRAPSITRDARSAQLIAQDGARKTWRYDIAIPKTALWLVSEKAAQPAFVTVDKRPSTLAPASAASGADAGSFPLLAGNHSVMISAANLAGAPEVSLVSGCNVVTPAGGWSAGAPLNFGTLARTLVQAIKQNSRLPAVEALPGVPVKGNAATIIAPSEGTYTLLVAGAAMQNAAYRVDGCQESRATGAATADGWREGATVLLLGAGEHQLTFTGVDGTKSDGRVRLVRRSGNENDYLAVLQSMGVKLPVAEAKHAGLEVVPGAIFFAAPLAAPLGAVDPFNGLASRVVTRGEAEAILGTPSVARLLKNGMPALQKTAPGGPKNPGEEESEERKGSYVEPVSPTIPGDSNPDPL